MRLEDLPNTLLCPGRYVELLWQHHRLWELVMYVVHLQLVYGDDDVVIRCAEVPSCVRRGGAENRFDVLFKLTCNV